MPICKISGKEFNVSEIEKSLREKLGVPIPEKLSKYIFQELAAFWPHFAIHKRKCDATGKDIISVFDEDCPYPVWYREYWAKNSNPPSVDFDFNKSFFEQLWDLFQKCPIPHNVNLFNENCEYADDWWHSKNCYLSHSGVHCEDCYYSFRIFRLKDCQYCVFSFNSEKCVDLINSHRCFNVKYALNSRDCRDSNFLFDCHNCSNCVLCWNLRNKEYCINNKQYTKEEYKKELEKFNVSSRKNYKLLKENFHKIIKTKAWWRNQDMEKCDNSSGDYMENCKNAINNFFIEEAEDTVNSFRGMGIKDVIDTVSPFSVERCYYSSMPQIDCYEIRFCNDVSNSKYMEYCIRCLNCQSCFACCGLVNKKYCILNKQYSPEEYEKLVLQIKEKMKQEGVHNQFFPGYFSANPYDESLAGFHWPISIEQQKNLGFRSKNIEERKNENYLSISNIPDVHEGVSEGICNKVFWDELAKRPFQINKLDIVFSKKNKAPLPDCFYISRIKENFSWMFCSAELRETTCAITGEKILTGLPEFLNGRILSRDAYLKEIY